MNYFTPSTVLRIGPVELKLSDSITVGFRAYEHEIPIHLGAPSGHKSKVRIMQYMDRLDKDEMLLIVDKSNYMNMPREFHAMVTVAAPLLFFNNNRNRVYEDERDMIIDVRAILRGTALRYGVDVNDMVNFYPQARVWLGHRQLSHPLTLEELTGNLIRQGRAEVKQ